MVFAWILPFSVLARIQPSRYSLGPFSDTHLDFYFYGTHPDSTFSVLARIPPSWYSPGPFSSNHLDFYFLGTCLDSTFSVLARIPPFRYSLGFLLFDTRPDSTFFGTRSDPTFPVLTRTLLRYSPGFLRARLGSDSHIFFNSVGVHTSAHTHMLSCSLVQMIGSSEIYFRVFFIKALAYQMCTLGHTLYQFCGYWMLWNKMDDFS